MKSYPTLLLSVLLFLTMSTGCMKSISTKDSNDQIEAIRTKVERITYDVPEELLKECEWLAPLESNTKKDRVQTITTNIERHVECYHLNDAKLQFLRALRQHNNGE